jgi:hypothetical protein
LAFDLSFDVSAQPNSAQAEGERFLGDEAKDVSGNQEWALPTANHLKEIKGFDR